MMLYILTLTWNGSDKLSSLKDSLINNLSDINYTWLIKDNASKDDTLQKVASWENKNVNCIPYKNNLQNFSAGVNFLFNEASPQDNDLVLLLNNDVIFQDTTSIKNMVDIINKDKTVGAVGARLLYTNTNTIQHAGVVFDNLNGLPCHFRSHQVSTKDDRKNRLFQVVTGAVLLTKADYFRNVFKNNKSGINGMDENYHWAFDDVDLCLSIRYNLDKKIVYCGETSIFHEESASLKKNPTNHLFMKHNATYLLNKWRGKYQMDRDIYTKDCKYNLYNG
jgi:GT2 family glycosyltransferase